MVVTVFVPTFAWGGEEEPASVTVGDNFFQEVGGAAGDTRVDVTAGSTVSFSSASGTGFHNVQFREAPASCTMVSGPPSSATAVPATVAQGPWVGTCTFDTPGTYTFYCFAHA